MKITEQQLSKLIRESLSDRLQKYGKLFGLNFGQVSGSEGSDPPGAMYTKTDDVEILFKGSTADRTGRTVLRKSTGERTTMKGEYDAMVRMHSILGKNSVRPGKYKAIKDGGEYTMEKVTGDTLNDIFHFPERLNFEYSPEDIKSFEQQVRDIQTKLKKVGFEHGDIKSNNFIVDGQTKTVKVFDPAGLQQGEKSLRLDDDQFAAMYKEFNDAL